MEAVKERLAPFVMGIVTCLLSMAAYNALSARLEPEPVQFVADSAQAADEAAELCVHVVGQVAAPGVYLLPSGSRVLDAVQAAGGFLADADPQTVNLAMHLVDAQQIRIPIFQEGTVASVTLSQESGLVDLNVATAEELDRLPGIGPVTAASILQYRIESGPFGSCEELLEVPGIGDATYSRIKDLVIVY